MLRNRCGHISIEIYAATRSFFHYKEREFSPVLQAPAQVIAMKIFRNKIYIIYCIAFFE